jgi:phosphoglycolate phosphatase-like HAD superfamily hydrolase
VGEQVSDTVAASDVLIRAIGFANKAEKIEKFKAASADLVITSMKELFAYL